MKKGLSVAPCCSSLERPHIFPLAPRLFPLVSCWSFRNFFSALSIQAAEKYGGQKWHFFQRLSPSSLVCWRIGHSGIALLLGSIYFGITPLKAQLVFGLARPRIILTPESQAPTVSPFFPFKRAISPQDSVGDGVLYQAERHQCVFPAGFPKHFHLHGIQNSTRFVKLFR